MRAIHRELRLIAAATIFLAGMLADVPIGRAAPSACFTETGQCIDARFLAYWQEHGGLALNGLPLTGAFMEQLGTGEAGLVLVQYFERTRLEYHPQNPAPYQILLGQFGRIIYPTNTQYAGVPWASPQPGARFFPETRHNVRGTFLTYWDTNGGLPQFGLPLTEEFSERLEDGQEYTTQYFERARFEYHPENPAPYDVLLGQFGRRIVAARDPDAPQPFPIEGRRGEMYRGALGVRIRLGAPTGPERAEQGTLQQFERGTMFYRADTRTILVAMSGVPGVADGLSSPGPYWDLGEWRAFADTWEPGQDPGGGGAPGSGYVPRRGFGKVWRENPAVRESLGYATTPEEAVVPLVVQPFAGGLLIDRLVVESRPIRGQSSYALPNFYLFYATQRYELRK